MYIHINKYIVQKGRYLLVQLFMYVFIIIYIDGLYRLDEIGLDQIRLDWIGLDQIDRQIDSVATHRPGSGLREGLAAFSSVAQRVALWRSCCFVYTLWLFDIAIEHGRQKQLVYLLKIVIFHGEVSNNQRVTPKIAWGYNPLICLGYFIWLLSVIADSQPLGGSFHLDPLSKTQCKGVRG